ncbi:MAG: TIGR04283 family arsenosugar biosynthesis glycosyltransferase [Candidatus Lambdaproteobacteria bacterium]|nr:TIGR04283 family arsenosugar biosynthesis glycosyltransferase [Candidatus Lambdaproteobacteria bacterium]
MRLSIVMPVLNEAAVIERALSRLRALAPEAEVIVADGGSTDGTGERAAAHAHVVTAARGRARQLNAGVRAAGGEWLLFLHADTVLPPGFEGAIRHAAGRGFRAGAYRLRIEGRHPLLPLLAWGANARTRCTGLALGDQALFVQQALFEEQGGFPDQPILEDYEFTRRLRARGIRLDLARQVVTTSGRRWDRDGFWRTWWQMRTIYHRYARDPASAAELARHYRDVR